MKNTSTINLILLTISLAIPQMAQADNGGCGVGVKRNLIAGKIELPLKSSGDATTSASAGGSSSDASKDLRTAVSQEFLDAHPEVNAVGSAQMNATGLFLSSVKVSQCIVMINLHVLEAATTMKSSTDGVSLDNLMTLSDEDLSKLHQSRFTLGFRPNGRIGFNDGHDILVNGTVWKTGRRVLADGTLEKLTNRRNDFVLLKVENPSREFLKLPNFAMASPEEIEKAVKEKAKASTFGQPQALVKDGQQIFRQESVEFFSSGGTLLSHKGIVTPGGSSSVMGIEVKSDKGPNSTYKMLGLLADTRSNPKTKEVEAVHVAAFREAVTSARSIKCD